MADHCGFCDTRRPEGGTNILVLNEGELWLEFCQSCGESEVLTNDKGEEITVAALFERCTAPKEPKKSWLADLI